MAPITIPTLFKNSPIRATTPAIAARIILLVSRSVWRSADSSRSSITGRSPGFSFGFSASCSLISSRTGEITKSGDETAMRLSCAEMSGISFTFESTLSKSSSGTKRVVTVGPVIQVSVIFGQGLSFRYSASACAVLSVPRITIFFTQIPSYRGMLSGTKKRFLFFVQAGRDRHP